MSNASFSELGIPGYSFADLHEPERLASLHDRFCEQVANADPALWREWQAYAQAPDAARSPVETSNLLVAMGRHVSRFVKRLFNVGADARAIDQRTRELDDLFRFKVDFVRRRALPLLKAGAHIERSTEDDAAVARLVGDVDGDFELALARAGCGLLDLEKTDKAAALKKAAK